MKIVINSISDGLELSHAAIMRYAELKGLTLFPYWYDSEKRLYVRISDIATVPSGYQLRYVLEDFGETITDFPRESGYGVLRVFDIPRDDPTLVQVIEELGSEESSAGWDVNESCKIPYAHLQVIEIPDGIEWEILYKGDCHSEFIAEKGHYWHYWEQNDYEMFSEEQ